MPLTEREALAGKKSLSKTFIHTSPPPDDVSGFGATNGVINVYEKTQVTPERLREFREHVARLVAPVLVEDKDFNIVPTGPVVAASPSTTK